jgi:hypothetical protein
MARISNQLAKPEPRKRAKARRRRREVAVIKDVRAAVAERDGSCRLLGGPFGPCTAVSEWAHFGSHRRSATRGMDPEERHTSEGSLMLCGGPAGGHHHAYDKGSGDRRLQIDAVDPARGCDGPLRYEMGSIVYVEPELSSTISRAALARDGAGDFDFDFDDAEVFDGDDA